MLKIVRFLILVPVIMGVALLSGCRHSDKVLSDGFFMIKDKSVDIEIPMVVKVAGSFFHLSPSSFNPDNRKVRYDADIQGVSRSYWVDVNILHDIAQYKRYLEEDLKHDSGFDDYKLLFTNNDKSALYKGMAARDFDDGTYFRFGCVDFSHAQRNIVFEIYQDDGGYRYDYDGIKDIYDNEMVFDENRQLSTKKYHNAECFYLLRFLDNFSHRVRFNNMPIRENNGQSSKPETEYGKNGLELENRRAF